MQTNQGSTIYSKAIRWWKYPLLVLVMMVLLGCALSTPTSTPNPTPTSTVPPTSTPTSTPPPQGEFDLTADQDQLALLLHLLSFVPGGDSQAAFLNTRAVQQNPDLSESRSEFSLENLGLAEISSPDIADSLESLVLSTAEDGRELIIVLNGHISIDALLQDLRGRGISMGTAPEIYRSYKVWHSSPSAPSAMSLTAVDNTTLVLARAAPIAGNGVAAARLQDALDAFDGVTPGLLDYPEVLQLANNLPSGFATVVDRDCRGIFPIMEGCAAAGGSGQVVGPSETATTLLAVFGNETQAMAAMPELRETFEGVEVDVHQKGSLVWTSLFIPPLFISQMLEGFSP